MGVGLAFVLDASAVGACVVVGGAALVADVRRSRPPQVIVDRQAEAVYASRAVVDEEIALGKSVDLARSQLIAQSARLDALDLEAFALLGLDAAVIAALVGAKGDLGRRWWVALIGVGVSVAFGLLAALVRPAEVSHGPEPSDFYGSVAWDSPAEFMRTLLERLQMSLRANRAAEDLQRGLLAFGVSTLVLTGLYSIFVFTLWR